MTTYGLFNNAYAKNYSEEKIHNFYRDGYLIIENAINLEVIDSLIAKIEHYLNIQEMEAIKENINLSEINEENLLRCPLAYDRFFYEALCLNKSILDPVTASLGPNFQLHLQNAIINRAHTTHHQSSWHRDIPYQPYLPSNPMSIGALYCLTDFNEKTGGTYLVPGSHQIHDSQITNDYLEKNKISPTIKAGGVILFDSFIWHRARNNISNTSRIGVNNVFTTPIIKQQISLPNFLPKDYCQNDLDKKLLGYNWIEATSVTSLRKMKKK